MKTLTQAAFRLAFAAVAFATLTASAQRAEPLSAQAAFDKLKSLAGEWTGKAGDPGKEQNVTIIYRVTSGGHALAETMFPGTEHEMITMYHLDGDKLLLTHYCAVGNQPRMALTKKSTADTLDFDFVGGTNMKSRKDGHMHAVRIRFVDHDTVASEWLYFKDGKNGGSEKFTLKRKN